jgi:hypothetical protein
VKRNVHKIIITFAFSCQGVSSDVTDGEVGEEGFKINFEGAPVF